MANFNILLLTPSFDEVGGVSSFCKALIKNLNSRFEIDHLQTGNQPGNRNPIKRVYFFLGNAFKLRERLRKNGYRLIHLNPSLVVGSILRDSFYVWIIHHFGYKKCVMFHGWNENLAETIIKNTILRSCFKKIYGRVELILVLCHRFKKQLEAMGIDPKRIRIVTTMYHQEDYVIQSNSTPTERTTQILFMAVLLRAKGVYIAAEVAKLLVENGVKDFCLTFAGEGPEYSGLKDYIRKNKLDDYIKTVGYVEGKAKQEVLEKGDIFLLPSAGEGCPVVVLEAMGAGLAVVSTSVGAIPDIVEQGLNGILIESNDPIDFYNATISLIENRELLTKMQIANRKKAKENFEAGVVTKKFESLYFSVMEE
jgi:glycosyltransferase involved in cell wall biosynthesis